MVRRHLPGRRGPGRRQGGQPRRAGHGRAPCPPGSSSPPTRTSTPSTRPACEGSCPHGVDGLDVDDTEAPAAAARDCQVTVRGAGVPSPSATPSPALRAAERRGRPRGAGGGGGEIVRHGRGHGVHELRGMNETFTNVAGADAVVDRGRGAGRRCGARWSSPTAPPGALTTSRRSRSWQRMVDSPHRRGHRVHRRPRHRELRPPGDRGRLRPGRGGGRRPGGARQLRVGQKTGECRTSTGTKATRIVRGGDGRDQRVEVPAEDQARPALLRRPGAGDVNAWRERSSGTTARPRTSSSPSTTSASGSSSPGPSPRWRTPPPRAGRAGGHRAGVRARRGPGRGRRTCAHLALSPGGRPARPRRGAGGTDDDPRLGAHHAGRRPW